MLLRASHPIALWLKLVVNNSASLKDTGACWEWVTGRFQEGSLFDIANFNKMANNIVNYNPAPLPNPDKTLHPICDVD